jgi:hypothetical protein
MVMTRTEIIELVVVRAAPGEQKQLRQALSAYSTEELKQIEQAIVSQAVSNVAEDELIRIQAEIAAERELFRLSREPQRKAEAERQEKRDRETFKQAARSLKSFGVTDANLSVTRSTLGPNFTVYSIQQALASNALSLSPPSQEELNEWDRAAIEANNQRLLSMDIPSLRKLAREAGARGPAAPELDQIQKVRSAERSQQFQPLTEDSRFKSEIIDYELVQQLSPLELKQLFQIYGSDQITARIKEWNSKVQRNLY